MSHPPKSKTLVIRFLDDREVRALTRQPPSPRLRAMLLFSPDNPEEIVLCAGCRGDVGEHVYKWAVFEDTNTAGDFVVYLLPLCSECAPGDEKEPTERFVRTIVGYTSDGRTSGHTGRAMPCIRKSRHERRRAARLRRSLGSVVILDRVAVARLLHLRRRVPAARAVAADQPGRCRPGGGGNLQRLRRAYQAA